jgi:hypothetical protein
MWNVPHTDASWTEDRLRRAYELLADVFAESAQAAWHGAKRMRNPAKWPRPASPSCASLSRVPTEPPKTIRPSISPLLAFRNRRLSHTDILSTSCDNYPDVGLAR